MCRGNLGGVDAFAKFFDHFSVELGNVVGLAAGHEAAVGDDGLIDPFRARIFKISLDGFVAGEFAAFDDAGIDEGPWAVTDGGDGFALLEKRGDKSLDAGVTAELVGIHDAPGEEKCVIIVGPDGIDGEIDRDVFAPVGVVPAFDLTGLKRNDFGGGPGGVEGFSRLKQFGLLETVGGENGDAFSGERFIV